MDRSPHHPIDSLSARRRRLYAAAGAACAAVAAWGSWYPFTVRPLPADLALEMWRRSAALPLSPTDALSNFLLFVPIGLFATAALAPRRGWRDTTWVLALGAGLSLVLESGQMLVPWRTPSILDVAAETLGLLCGWLLWRLTSAWFDAPADRLVAAWRRAALVERGLWLYAAAFAVAWLVPFDFTIRPDEILDKYSHKRLLLPWMVSPDEASTTELWSAAVAAMPLGWTAATRSAAGGEARRSALAATIVVGAMLLALTLVQITVFSRTTDSTVALVAIAGAAAGAVAAGWGARSGAPV